MINNTYCGFIAIIGRPNVGKSTLLNSLIGEKISITAHKPQTTRHRIIGVKTKENKQAIYIDTPGLHKPTGREINKRMNKAAKTAIRDVDTIIFVVEALRWVDEDQRVLDLLINTKIPILLIINKIDLIADKAKLLPYINEISQKLNFHEIIPISAKQATQVDILQQKIFDMLPMNPWFFEKDQVTDKNDKFRIAEIVREKLTRTLEAELPYSLTVEVERIEYQTENEHGKHGMSIYIIIWVEKSSQKPIVIGAKGSLLKEIGRQARLEINNIFNTRAHLQLWVKVREGWSRNQKELKNLNSCDMD